MHNDSGYVLDIKVGTSRWNVGEQLILSKNHKGREKFTRTQLWYDDPETGMIRSLFNGLTFDYERMSYAIFNVVEWRDLPQSMHLIYNFSVASYQ